MDGDGVEAMKVTDYRSANSFSVAIISSMDHVGFRGGGPYHCGRTIGYRSRLVVDR
jgi:hypothetical protein